MSRTQKWNSNDRFEFATCKLRATTIPNKKREANRNACRNWKDYA